ncbi:Glycerophosphodiester phosphodiesterase [bioreactor metagenome]|uniref:Glycerophosphodiester phosphodiesterase n=1 Tax=bioreactor metagenome TaxID=1076179 RepID=A0A645A7N9_9ZZZZ
MGTVMLKKFGKLQKVFLLALATAVLTCGFNGAQVSAKGNVENFDIQAHRGGRDLRPENTLDAFANALEIGVTTLEMDTYVSADGVVFVTHNPQTYSYLTKLNGKWLNPEEEKDVRTLKMSELKKYDIGGINPAHQYYKEHGKLQVTYPGAQYPTLDEVFNLVKAYGNDNVLFNIETKSFPDPSEKNHANNITAKKFVKALHDVIVKHGMQNRVTIQSFDWATLVEMKTLDSNISLAALTGPGKYLKPDSPWIRGSGIEDLDDFDGSFVQAAESIGANIISPSYKLVTRDIVNEAHTFGLKIIPWTVNDRKAMIEMIDLGVDGIISDNPVLLREVCIEKGLTVPQPSARPANMPYNDPSKGVQP